jgi:hypothetical protein
MLTYHHGTAPAAAVNSDAYWTISCTSPPPLGIHDVDLGLVSQSVSERRPSCVWREVGLPVASVVRQAGFPHAVSVIE